MPELKSEANVVTECKPEESSDEVCEPATTSVPEGILVEFEGMKWSPSPSTVAEGNSLIYWVTVSCLFNFPAPVSLPSTKLL